MFADSLLFDDPAEIAEGTLAWEQIRSAIENLDGQRRTEVSIARRGTETHVSISGGPDRFLISAAIHNDIFYDFTDPSADPATTLRICSGGQFVTVSARETADLPTALQIAKSFSETGEIDPDFVWLRNPVE